MPTLVQHNPGTQVTSSFGSPPSVSTQFNSNVTTGHMLMAVVSSTTASNPVASIGQVSDNQGNKWRYACETTDITSSDNNGTNEVSIWICESCSTSTTPPTVTALMLGYPGTTPTGMQIAVFEFSGFSGYELVRTWGVSGQITASPASWSTNYSATVGDLLIAVICGNQTSVGTPTNSPTATYAAITANSTQGFWVYETTVATTGVQTISWGGLTSITTGCGILISFRPTGVSASSPHVCQTTYQEYINYGSVVTTQVSQTFPVNPTAGNALYAWIWHGDVPNYIISVTDTANNKWTCINTNAQASGSSSGWGFYKVDSCIGAATTLTATWAYNGQRSNNFFLMEIANLPGPMQLDSLALTQAGYTTTTSTAVNTFDIAFSFSGGVYSRSDLNPSLGWVLLGTDMPACGFWLMTFTAGCTTVASNSNGANVSTLTTLYVASSSFYSSTGGQVQVNTSLGTAVIAYTGTASGQLTGCSLVSVSASGTNTIATGYLVTPITGGNEATLTMKDNGSGPQSGWSIQGAALSPVTLVPPSLAAH